MTPTLCPRCGGHKDHCECAVLRREGMMMAAEIARGFEWWDHHEAVVHKRIAEHIERLARNPEPL